MTWIKASNKKNRFLFVIGMNAIAMIINFVGKYLAVKLGLPLWLDSIGTCMIAYMYGPICGAIVGAGLNITYGIFDSVSFIYATSSISIGIICGLMARKKYFDTFYKTCIIGVNLTMISIIISVPLNIIFYDGHTSNIFGDGIYEMFCEKGIHKWVSAAMGEFALDFLDKMLTVILVYLVLKGIKHYESIKSKTVLSVILVLVCSTTVLFHENTIVYAQENSSTEFDEGFTTYTIYNDKNGLPGGEANDIAFSNDGYVWVGTYSGLYKYDGSSFTIWEPDIIKNVNCIYTDEEGRVFVGTNDRGLVVMVDGHVVHLFNEENGLSSNSISCISCDIHGNYYVGTKEKVNVIQIAGGMQVVNTLPEIDYAYSICGNKTGQTVIISNSGKAHVIQDGQYLYDFESRDDKEGFTSAYFSKDELLIGTYSNTVFSYKISETEPELIGRKTVNQLRHVRALMENNGIIWACADNGIGFWNSEGEFHIVNSGNFTTSIDNMGSDYQGNIWVTSSRQGLLKISPSAFFNIYKRGNYETDVINAVTEWNGKLYIGSDNGLDVFSLDYELDRYNCLSETLQGQRIRNLMVDSKNHLWISISTGFGLVEVFPDGTQKIYNEESGTICGRFRSAIELTDGTIAVAEDSGIDFIKDGKVVSSITAADGLIAPMILSLYQGENGDLYAGTDGGGLIIIRDYKIYDKLTMQDGLSSGVILRIAKDTDGLFLVTSNGLNYVDSQGNARYINKFPYSNNFDFHYDEKGNIWVLSSAGIYVVNREELLADESMNYTLLDLQYGLDGSITSNSWSYSTEDGKLYIACDNGCYLVDTNNYNLRNASYRMTVDYVLMDDSPVEISDNRSVLLDGDSKTLILHAVVPNYTTQQIYVGYCLEGYEDKETIVAAKELGEIKYYNLPSGEYRFVLNLYTDNQSQLLESVSYNIKKDMRIFEHSWFKAYVILIYGLFIAWITWMLVKRFNERVFAQERAKLEQMRREAKVSNETIMAIAKTVDAKDPRTSKHSERVAEYATKIAKKLGWSTQECEDLYKTGLLHDIGKIGIPDAVLNKPGKLTEEEYAIMKTHVDRGAEILRGFTIVKDVDLGTRFHHERYDGKGYPQGLKGEEIPIQARIIGVVDAFDAMTSNRVYRNKLDFDTVLKEMKRCSGTQFDPKITAIFLELIDEGEIDVEVLYEK